MKRHYWLLSLAGLALSVGIPVFMGGRELLPVLGRLQVGNLALLLGLIFVAWNFNAGRVRVLVGGTGSHLGQRKAVAVVMATEFAICATPGGSGGPVTYTWLLHRHGLPTSRGTALYAVDQIVDMVFFVVALAGFSLFWLIVPSDLQMGWQVAAMAAALVSVLTMIWWIGRHYRRFMLMSGKLLKNSPISDAGRRRLARWALEFRRSLRQVREFSRRRLGALFVLCAGHWLLRYSVLYLAVGFLGGNIPWSYAFVMQMLSLSVGQATLMPGGSGGAEASGSLLLLPYMDAATAAGAILLWRFVTFYWYLIAGAPVFAVMAGRPLWRRIKGQKQDSMANAD